MQVRADIEISWSKAINESFLIDLEAKVQYGDFMATKSLSSRIDNDFQKELENWNFVPLRHLV